MIVIPVFRSCERWHTGACRYEFIRETFNREESQDILSSRLQNHELDKLNAICKRCGFPLEIQRRECPVCLGTIRQDEDIPRMEIDALNVYNYRCSGCGRELFSYVLL